jgi:spore germination cell wall hydrolase CwlJ-like protein
MKFMKIIFSLLIIVFSTVGMAHGADRSLTQTDLYWLAKNIYYEARGESTIGQIMVGIVTISRQQSGKWGNTFKDVITYSNQF